ncbi:MAG: hypothetical protein ACK559_06090, partial [bacterium]
VQALRSWSATLIGALPAGCVVAGAGATEGTVPAASESRRSAKPATEATVRVGCMVGNLEALGSA